MEYPACKTINPEKICKKNFSLYLTLKKSSAIPVRAIKITPKSMYGSNVSLVVELAIAKHTEILRKTESPPDLVAFERWEDRMVTGSRILLLEKTL